MLILQVDFTTAKIKNCYNLMGLRVVHTATARASFFEHFRVPLLSQCEHFNWSPWISIFAINVVVMNDSNGNDTKIMKIMPLPSQCEKALSLVQTVAAKAFLGP